MGSFYGVRSGIGYLSLITLSSEYDDEPPHLAASTKPPVEQGGGERVLNLLGDIFLRSRHVTDKEFIVKLERRGIEHTVKRIDTATCIEVGRFCYRFNEEGQSRGGWINNCAADRRSEWEKWAALLTEPLS